MRALSDAEGGSLSWQSVLRQRFTKLDDLADFLQLNQEQRACLSKQAEGFPLLIPRRLAEKMQKQTLDDPILRQFVPLIDEERIAEHFSLDAVGDKQACRTPRLLQKYCGRALLLCTSACAMHCRYCFRRHYPYETEKQQEWSAEFKELREDTSIKEVLLSGGDPLSLSDRALVDLLAALEGIPHIKRLRFHTRFLIGIPERITNTLCAALRHSRLQIWCVIHSNHPKELDSDVQAAVAKLRAEGVLMLNQSVLLRGVNDHADVLCALSERLLDIGVMPYYLHQLDRVQGAAHFEVPEDEGRALVSALHARLPGYGVPRYVREEEGMPGKTILL